MMMKSRYISAAALLLLAGASLLHAQELFRYPVVGAVTDASATIAVWLAKEGAFKIQYALDENFSNARTTETITPSAAEDFAAKVELSALLPATRYYYRITSAAGAPASRTFSFKTFPKTGQDAPVTIFFGSCQQGRINDVGKTFDVAGSMGGDVFVQMGDWGYPDYLITGYPTAPGSIRASYELRLDTNYAFARRILSQMGMAYIWDDHDFGGNNSNGLMPKPLKQQLFEAYRRYIPHYPLPNRDAGIWQSFRIGNVELFLIDDRSQRSPIDSALKGNTFAPPPGHSMLAGFPVSGVDQRRWLLDAIRTSTARWKVLVSQVFFNPATSVAIPLTLLLGRPDGAREFADKWVGFPADVDSMKALFDAGYDRNFLVISGDAHTNLYDDGTHSIVPEFMAGALDKQNSNIYDQFKGNGLDVWTAGQPGSASAVGRIRVETSPRHRMIIESFDTLGNKLLTLEMVDSSGSAGVPSQALPWRISNALVTDSGKLLRIELEGSPNRDGIIELFDVEGKKVMEAPVQLAGRRETAVRLERQLPSGSYLGRILIGKREFEFRVMVTR